MTSLFPMFEPPHVSARVHVTARQWQAAKMRPTQFGDHKHTPNKTSYRASFLRGMYERLRQEAQLKAIAVEATTPLQPE